MTRPSFPARYPGLCGECDGPFDFDDPIRRTSPGRGQYAHERCPDPEDKPTRFQGTTLEEMGF